MPGMLDGDQANMSLLFWRKVVSSTFSSRLRRELIRAFLSGLSRSMDLGDNSGLFNLYLLFLVGQSRFLGVSQDRVNLYDLLWGLLDGIATLNLLDGFLRHELNAGAFSYDLFEVYLPRSAIGCVMPMCSMEGTILVGTSLVRNSLQRWWSLQPGICWMAFFAINSVQGPFLTIFSRCIFRDRQLAVSCPCVPWKAQYLLVLLLSGTLFKGGGLFNQGLSFT
ncbi:unnamed protein product [Prunus armeniaca]